jgi:hypothetical protein
MTRPVGRQPGFLRMTPKCCSRTMGHYHPDFHHNAAEAMSRAPNVPTRIRVENKMQKRLRTHSNNTEFSGRTQRSTSFRTRGSQVQILPLRPANSSKNKVKPDRTETPGRARTVIGTGNVPPDVFHYLFEIWRKVVSPDAGCAARPNRSAEARLMLYGPFQLDCRLPGKSLEKRLAILADQHPCWCCLLPYGIIAIRGTAYLSTGIRPGDAGRALRVQVTPKCVSRTAGAPLYAGHRPR